MKKFKTLGSKPALARIRRRSWWLSDRKNYAMSKANMLIVRFLTHPDLMRWVRVMSTSVIDLCLSLSSWHRWIKLLDIEENCILSPIIFSKLFPVVLSNTIGWNNLGKSYKILLGLGIITIDDVLKCDGQWPKSIHVLAISISLSMHSSSLMISLRCLQDNLFSPEANKLLQLSIILKSSFFEKGAHVIISLLEISSNRQILTWWSWVELNNLWRASYKLFSSKHGWLLKCIALVARRFLFLTQFMSFQGPHFLLVILSIFPSKKFHFVFLTIFLNLF